MCKFKPDLRLAGVAQRMKRSMVNIRQIPKLFCNCRKVKLARIQYKLKRKFLPKTFVIEINFFCKEEYFSISEQDLCSMTSTL